MYNIRQRRDYVTNLSENEGLNKCLYDKPIRPQIALTPHL